MKTLFKTLIVLFILFISTLSFAQVHKSNIDNVTINEVINLLISKHGESQKFRIQKGVNQVAEFWQESDGTKEEFKQFCLDNFAGDESAQKSLFDKIEYYNEILNGYLNEMMIELRLPIDLDWGKTTPIDLIMGSYNPYAHLIDDLFANKYIFLILLNFPKYSLEEREKLGPDWNRLQWAYARLAGNYTARVPADINQKVSDILTDADQYISEYNIYMGNLIDNNQEQLFPSDLKLVSHWGLRDEIKARYSNPQDIDKQKMIYKVMERIILQEIPAAVINSPKYKWNPYTNETYENGVKVNLQAENNVRYQKFLNAFNAMRMFDPYFPDYNTHILRSFESGREISLKKVEEMYEQLMSSKQVKEVAALIKKRLGRDLLPFDIWYTGFKKKSTLNESELDKITKEKYPTAEAFEKDLYNILVKLDFSEESAKYIAEKIQVDPSRGPGHATGSLIKKFKARLRTRVGKDGMNYKGYNIAMHEFGHTVEQTLTLYKMDYYTLIGVPNVSFTEAFAFVFQSRDLEVLGIKDTDPDKKYYDILDNFWKTYEIMGVSLVDIKVWQWLYQHPDATPEELKQAVVSIAKDVWNKYFADAFGMKDQIILAIYSHMIDNPLYLPNYAIGHIIEFQIENYLEGKKLGPEMERMCAAGNIIPQEWMKNAVGSDISVKPMLDAVNIALD
ncbi:MAG: hypothetical protein N2490_03520, partial [Ignavibacteria bacterium]|nr:hypothetical protein [Ignavibacteria bacterium]